MRRRRPPKNQSTDPRRALGASGEQLAADYLAAQGYRLVTANYRTRWGEIDLVVRRGPELHIVEVKTRRTPWGGDPLEQITAKKQLQIIKMAKLYLSRTRQTEATIYFSVVGIDLTEAVPTIEWLPDAFGVPD